MVLNAIAVTPGYADSAVATATYTLRVPTPTFSPAGGTYSTPQSVAIQDAIPGVPIYYTTDGSAPTETSISYNGPVTISKTTTLMAIAAQSGWSDSTVRSASYTIRQQLPATPAFSPRSGTYTTAQMVTLTDSTSGAAIYYTTDGSTPTTSSAQFLTPIPVSQTTTIKALASLGGVSSAVASSAYTLRVGTPLLSRSGGTYTSAQSVIISDSTPGATIFYTTNGSTPTTSSTPYDNTAIPVNQTTTIKAIAVLSGWSNSNTVSAAYTLKVPAPTFSLAAGTYTGAQSVTISDALAGARIYYTVNGSTPTTSSTLYTGAVSISRSRTLRAIAASTGWSNSSVTSASYTIH